MTHEFTSAQILDAIGQTLHEGNFEVAVSLLRLLAVQDPHAAQTVLDVVKLAADGAE